MNNTIILSELSKSIAELTQCTEADAETFVRELFLLAAEKLAADDEVTIPGIGTFKVNDEDIDFAPDSELAATLNAPFSAFEPVELPVDYEEEPETEAGTPPPHEEPEVEPDPEAEVEEEVTEAETEALSSAATCRGSIPADDESDATAPCRGATPTVEPRPQKSYCWVCWIVACLLCFAAGWIARGFLMDGRLPASEPEPVVAAEAEAVVAKEAEAGSLPSTSEPEPEPTPEPEPPTIVYDTIGANRYLTTMARAHYGQMEYWVYIYQENAAKLGNPDRLDAGTTVVIPPAEKYGLKAGDEAKIREATELAREIYSRFN